MPEPPMPTRWMWRTRRTLLDRRRDYGWGARATDVSWFERNTASSAPVPRRLPDCRRSWAIAAAAPGRSRRRIAWALVDGDAVLRHAPSCPMLGALGGHDATSGVSRDGFGDGRGAGGAAAAHVPGAAHRGGGGWLGGRDVHVLFHRHGGGGALEREPDGGSVGLPVY